MVCTLVMNHWHIDKTKSKTLSNKKERSFASFYFKLCTRRLFPRRKAIVVERWKRRRCEGLDQKRPPLLRWFIILLTADCHFRSQTARQLKVRRRRRPSSLAIANCVAASQNNLCNSNVAWATHVPDQVKDSSTTYVCGTYCMHESAHRV